MLRFLYIKIFCDVPTWMQVNFLEEKYQEKWENAYLTVKSATASRAISKSQTPGLWSNLQTKPNEQ